MDPQMNEKNKLKLSRKKTKSLREEQLMNNTNEVMESRSTEHSQDLQKSKKRRDSTDEAEERARRASVKKVNFDLQSNIEIKHSGHEENCEDMTKASGGDKQNTVNSDATNWVQRASWKSLVGQTGRVSFSLSSVLGQNFSSHSNINTTRAAAVDDDDTNKGLPMNKTMLDNNVSSWINGCSSTPPSVDQSRKSVINTTNKIHFETDASEPVKYQHNKFVKEMQVKGDGEEHAPPTTKIQKEMEPQTHSSLLLMVTSAKVCPFMRSDTSEQEWLEAKKAVKEIFKRSHKDALRSMKILHTKLKY